jgi:hypothetical protein
LFKGFVILEVKKIVKVFIDYFLFQFPSSEKEWLKINNEFEEKWQFMNCLRSADSEQIQTIPPKGSGSFFWDYKGSDSLVLLAIANSNYEFIYCGIETNSRITD